MSIYVILGEFVLVFKDIWDVCVIYFFLVICFGGVFLFFWLEGVILFFFGFGGYGSLVVFGSSCMNSFF